MRRMRRLERWDRARSEDGDERGLPGGHVVTPLPHSAASVPRAQRPAAARPVGTSGGFGGISSTGSAPKRSPRHARPPGGGRRSRISSRSSGPKGGKGALCYPAPMDTATAQPVRDLVAEAFDHAPVGEPFPAEVLAEIERAEADIRAGRGVRHEDLPAWLEEHARRQQSE